MICLQHVSLSREGALLLSNISFAIKAGESVALMGLNGAGKSTLLKGILGLYPDYQGDLTLMKETLRRSTTPFDKKRPKDKPKSREHIAYLPEKFTVQGSLTGQQYLDFFKIDYKEFALLLDFSTDTLQKKIKFYSKGMLQKLGLLYFFGQPKPLKIADELMSGLDFKTRQTVQHLIQCQHKKGTTFFFTTHTLDDALQAATRLLYIDNKTIAFDGDPHEWTEHHGIHS